MRKTVETVAVGEVGWPAADVWQVLRRFDDLSWALGQGVSSFETTGSGVGMLRTAIAPGDGGRIVEKLTRFDESEMSIEYVVVEGAIPGLADYCARAFVRSDEAGCRVQWNCHATVAPEKEEFGQTVLDAMADRMVTLFVSQFDS